MKHLIVGFGPKSITVKCGAKVGKADTTVWTSDVDCPQCRGESTPPPSTKRRIIKTSTT